MKMYYWNYNNILLEQLKCTIKTISSKMKLKCTDCHCNDDDVFALPTQLRIVTSGRLILDVFVLPTQLQYIVKQ